MKESEKNFCRASSKKDLNSLKAGIQKLLSAPGYRPMRVSELIATLKVPPSERKGVRQVLDQLLQEGSVVRLRKDRLILPSEADLVSGRIQMDPRGFGFLRPDPDPSGQQPPDIFISAEDTGLSMHGDRVLVRLHAAFIGGDRGQGTEDRRQGTGNRTKRAGNRGRVIRVLEKANPTLLGIYQKRGHFHCVAPDDPRMGRDIYIPPGSSPLRPKAGERVVVRLEEWKNRSMNPEGVIIEIIGSSDDPSLDLLVIIKKFRLRTDFPDEVLAEAEKLEDEIPGEEWERRLDMTTETVITIDPEDARDYDDALSLKKLPNGNWLLGVHIADVSHYVKPRTALDREAFDRGNSVYLPDRVLPMLPEKLSNGLCSLKEGVARLTRSVFFEMDPHGIEKNHWFQDAIIKSTARLAYPQVLPWLQPPSSPLRASSHEFRASTDKSSIPSSQSRVTSCEPRVAGSPQKPNSQFPILHSSLQPLLASLWSLASKVRSHRFKEGALDLDLPELKISCDPKGVPQKVEKQENDISHQLVEEFMLMANEAAAAETSRKAIPNLYRVHEDPDPEKLEQFRELAISNGFPMGDPAHRTELQGILKRISRTPEEAILKMHFLRSLKRAHYSPHPLGHFGLAKGDYTHFTSPIRRYPDLVVHRALPRGKSSTLNARRSTMETAKSKLTHPSSLNLNSVAQHCSAAERVADEAEKEAVRLKLLEYFERKMREHQLDDFEAMITEVRNFGLFVELPEFMLSGMIRVSDLADDFYRFDPLRQTLTGKKNHRVLKPGGKVRVQVARVDRFKKLVDFMLAE